MQIDKFAEIIRSMSKHEDTLRAQRIQLLMSAQAILFAATSIIWPYNLGIVMVISLLGIFFSWIIYPSLFNGHLAGDELRRIWKERQKLEVDKFKIETKTLEKNWFLTAELERQEVEKLKEKDCWPPVFALEYTTELGKKPEKVPCSSFEPNERKTSKASNVDRNIMLLLTFAWLIIFTDVTHLSSTVMSFRRKSESTHGRWAWLLHLVLSGLERSWE